MTDRERVIKGLEVCVDRVPGKYTCEKCPYETDGNDCEINLTKDAIALLKEQEAVGWIKVSDRLPFSSQMVLVSYPAYTDEAGNQYVEGVGIGYLITTSTNKYWCRSDGTTFGELGFSSVNPIAWMPLPSPMKGGEQDD